MNSQERAEYLKRIAYDGPTDPDEKLLERLVRAHLEKIPFENLDVYDFRMIPDLSVEALFEKIVRQKRGGYCYELNMLFAALLESLGFSVYKVAARILWNKEEIPPLAHMGVIVQTDQEKYFCDVGYGGPGPKGLVILKDGEMTVDGEKFRVGKTEDGDILLSRLHHGEWKRLMCFSDRPVRDQDFELLNFYCARSEKILFTRARVINLCTPSGSKAVMNMELTVKENGETAQKQYRTLEELTDGLYREFGIRVQLPGTEHP